MMRSLALFVLSFLLTSIHAHSQVTLINLTDVPFDAIYITPADQPLTTTGVCFEIKNTPLNSSPLSAKATMRLDYKTQSGKRYDVYGVHYTSWRTYMHIAFLHSILIDENNPVTIETDNLPRDFFFYCEEPKMNENETLLVLDLSNESSFRITKLEYSINIPGEFVTARYLAPWQPLRKGQQLKLYLTHRTDAEKKVILRFSLEKNGVMQQRNVVLSFADKSLSYQLED